MVQVSKKNPDRLLRRVGRIVKTGFGQPSIFNTDAVVQELIRQGKSLEDARQGGCSGCVEEMPQIRQMYEQYGKEGLTVVAVAMDYDNPDYIKAFWSVVNWSTVEELYNMYR